MVNSFYDPSRFLAPFSLRVKLLLQELSKRSLGWDEAIPHSFSKQWSDWLEDLEKVAEFKVNCCIKLRDFVNLVTEQLHHFSDASQVGYGAVLCETGKGS